MDPLTIGTLGSLVLSIVDRLVKQGWVPTPEEKAQITALRKAVVAEWDSLAPPPPPPPAGGA